MEVEITCADKPSGYLQNPHEAISAYGWMNPKNGSVGTATRQQMVSWAKKYGNHAYVQDDQGNKVYCDVRNNSNGTEYLQTFADGRWTNNLLSLDSCSI